MKHTIQFYSSVLAIMCFGNFFSIETSGSVSETTSLFEEERFGDKNSLLTCEEENTENLSLNLSYLGLQKIRTDFISNPDIAVTGLNLEGNEIKELSFDDLKNLKNLNYLNLGNNEINVSSLLSSGSHPNLKNLVLDNMSYQHPTRNTCDGYCGWPVLKIEAVLPKLKYLYLRNIKSTIISSEWYKYVPKLTHLYLSDNNLCLLYDGRCDGEHFLNNIPPTLTHLHVDRCNIKNNMLQIKSDYLVSLSLDGNSFSCTNFDYRCMMSFQSLPALRYLSLANSGLNGIPSETFDFLAQLVYLDISENKISSLPKFKELINLQVLNLNNNQLSNIPNECSMKKLIQLYINNNNIHNLSASNFGCLATLQILSLSGNRIESIPQGTFENLPNLIVLNLSHNKISNLNIGYLMNFRYLYLNNNLFNSVEDISLSNTTLASFVLNDNPIRIVKPHSFTHLAKNMSIFINGEFPNLDRKLYIHKAFFSSKLDFHDF